MRATGRFSGIESSSKGAVPARVSRLFRYGLAGLLAAVAVWLRLLMNLEMNNDALRMLSIIAVVVAAWFGGFGPGAFATIIGLAGSFAITTGVPAYSIAHTLRLVLFAMTGFIVSALTEALGRTTMAWRRAEEAQENRVLQERNRMAREIHDTLAQGLTGIIIQLEAAEDTLVGVPKNAEVWAHLRRAQELSRMSLSEARRSVSALRPLSLEGKTLPDALSDRLATMTAGTGVRAVLTVQGNPYALSADTEDHLLRIGLEAVTNALKHARATLVKVVVEFGDDAVTLSVRDDGQGFIVGSPQRGVGFGLSGMWERAERIKGRFTLSSSPQAGTEIRVTVPRPSADEDPDRAAARWPLQYRRSNSKS